MPDYTTVTEVPGVGASQEQLSMLYTRYRFAAQFCAGKDVLEVACGSGHGLGYLARSARKVVGGDIDEAVLRYGREHYRARTGIELRVLDAQKLAFDDESFDVVILYEALYYLARPALFLQECRRVLRPDGVFLLCTVNKEWAEFNPSPFSTRYFTARELQTLLDEHGFDAELLGAFPVSAGSIRDDLVSLIKRAAVALHAMPKTMRGKQLLKRVFFGKLSPLPAEVTDGLGDGRLPAAYAPPEPIGQHSPDRFRVLYAVARVRACHVHVLQLAQDRPARTVVVAGERDPSGRSSVERFSA